MWSARLLIPLESQLLKQGGPLLQETIHSLHFLCGSEAAYILSTLIPLTLSLKVRLAIRSLLGFVTFSRVLPI